MKVGIAKAVGETSSAPKGDVTECKGMKMLQL